MATPLYHQIAHILKERITSGALGLEGAMATEQELCREFGVSRITIRQAMGALKQNGLLQSRRGVGTRGVPQKAQAKLVRSSGDPLHAALRTVPRLSSFGKVPAPAEVAAFFGVEAGASLLRFVRVHDLTGEPLSIVVSYLPLSIGEKLTRASLRQPIHDILWQRFGLRQKQSLHSIRVGRADAEISALLAVELAAPVLRIQSSVFLTDSRPIRWTENFFREDRYEYRAEMEWAAPKGTPPDDAMRQPFAMTR